MKKPLYLLSIILLLGNILFAQTNQFPVKEFYVSPEGNDAFDGTIEKPFATITQAQQVVRQFKQQDESTPVIVYCRGGKYYLDESLTFTSKDGGSKKAPVVYKAFPGEQPVLMGGKALEVKWEAYKNGIYKAKVPKGMVFESLFIDEEKQILARYPNYDPNIRIYNGTAEDCISEERAKTWADPKGGYFHVIHRAMWGGFHYRITGKKNDSELTMEGGWQNNRPENGLHDKLRFVENIFEELDEEKEWFLDRKNAVLYWMPQKGIDPDKVNVEVAYLENFLHLKGEENNPVKYLSFEGLTFNRSVRTFMKTKDPLLRSDWTIYRGGAVLIEGAENCEIKNCDFRQIGSNAVFVNKYNRKVSISGCHIYDVGASAICFVGDTSAVRNPKFIPYGPPVSDAELDTIPGPKNNLYPAFCSAHDNLIHDIGKVEKQVAGIQISMASNISVSHNSIYNTPRAGINIGEGAWGGHLIEFNDVFNTVLETSDHGSFNSWGRDRFWMVGNDKTEKRVAQYPASVLWDAMETTVIRNNRMRCDHGWDIDLDDGSSNYHIYNNLCLKNGIKLREGYLRRVENNITLNNAMHPHVWLKNNRDIIRGNIFWTWHFPIRVDHWGSQVDYNWFITQDALEGSRKNGIEAHSEYGDPMFVDAQNGDFNLLPQSPVYALGWKTFPMDEFGVQSEHLKELAEQPEIPVPNLVQRTERKAFLFCGGEIKDIESAGELSATGMYDKVGALIVKVPTKGVFKRLKVLENDVIIKFNGSSVKDINHLFRDKQWFLKDEHISSITVWRNQGEVILK